MKRTLFIILAVVGVFLVFGLVFTSMSMRQSSGLVTESREFGFGGGASPDMQLPAMEEPAAAPAYDSAIVGDAYNSGVVQAQDRLVIENADLAIVVKDPKSRMAEITALANEMGGYVVSSNLYQSFTSFGMEVPEASIVIRVHAD